MSLQGLAELTVGATVRVSFRHPEGREVAATLICRLDTADEVAYFRHGGILNYVLAGRLAGAPRD